MEIRALTPAEQKYTYAQSMQLEGQTANIGHLRGDFDSSGYGFYTTWTDTRTQWKTDEFKAEFDEVINALRSDKYGLLKNRSAMSAYARQYADSAFKGCYCTEYGFRVDTEKHAYLLRCNPTRGDYNFYCYCFVKEWLDKHIQKAEQGIRFIDPNYKELFRIPDGGRIIVTNSWGEKREYSCRFIDECHTEVGNNIFHICEFAERMEYGGHTCEPVRDNLPERCYSVLSGSDEIIIIKRGEKGYFKTDIPVTDKDEARSIANEYNAKLGVSRAQEEAMKAGSMFGFQVPAADPRNYDADGKPVMPKDRGDAR